MNIDLDTWVYILHPRPVAVIVSGTWERYSAMPASWIMPVSRKPPMLAIAIVRSRYTYELIKEFREFVICVLSSANYKAVHFMGTVSGRKVNDKIGAAGLSKVRAKRIRAPIIGESLAVAECEFVNDVKAGDHNIVIGKVLEVYKKRDVEVQDPGKYRPLLHIGKNLYTEPSEKVFRA
mgnify:CR=1 FL=1